MRDFFLTLIWNFEIRKRMLAYDGKRIHSLKRGLNITSERFRSRYTMVDKTQSYQIAHAYFAAVTAGELPDAMLTPDMTAWITSGPTTMDKTSYQNAVRLLSAMLAGPLQFTIQALTADEDRVVAEATSIGRLINGEDYRQTYVFILRLRDGKIASVAEHYNALIAKEKLVPLMAAAVKKLRTQT